MPTRSNKRTVISLVAIAAASVIATLPARARADEFGDANKGRDFAETMCMDCHGVRRESKRSPRPEAPTFKAIADLPSTTRMALTVWFQSPHPTMPNLVLGAEDTDNLIAYILSLKDGP